MRTSLARRTRVLLGLFLLGATAIVGPACKDATQIDIELSSNVCLPGDTSFAVSVANPDDPQSLASLRPLDASQPVVVDLGDVFRSCETKNGFFALGSTTVVPSAKSTRALVQIVLGFGGQAADSCREVDKNPRCIFARRRVGFVEHTRITVPVFLDGLRCAGKDCDASDKTCFAGGCVSATADQCVDSRCVTPEEAKSGGAIPPDAPKPADGGFTVADGAQVATDASDPDVGFGEGGAEASTGKDATVDGPAEETCRLGTGLGCGKVPFSGNDAGVDGVCCSNVGGATLSYTCENPQMGGCNAAGTTRYVACENASTCTNPMAPDCYKPKGKLVGLCSTIVRCTMDAGSGRGLGEACGFASFCCAPQFDCVRGPNVGGPGYCLERP